MNHLTKMMSKIFIGMGLPEEYCTVVKSDRSDLSDFQCNGALASAKILKRPPREIAGEIVERLKNEKCFEKITVDGPGFINMRLTDEFIVQECFRKVVLNNAKKKVVIDYGGPNVAKPLHVGHLRSAVIGESLKRIGKCLGYDVIADVHVGDWGTPMGMLMAFMRRKYPEWTCFSGNCDQFVFPLSVDDLNIMYPEAAKLYKNDEVFSEEARKELAELQRGNEVQRTLWKSFVSLSIASIRGEFDRLNVKFDLWNGESDSDVYLDEVMKILIEENIVKLDGGALIMDVKEELDDFEVPPVILKKSDGAVTYAMTDLATIFQRVKDFDPDEILYVVDSRQSLHFLQVFRSATKAGLVRDGVLRHVGFGTVNGKDGKPFKTRDGGVMWLRDLIDYAFVSSVKEAGAEGLDLTEEDMEMLNRISISSLKFGDLSNVRTSNYSFDPDAFVSFEGKTGPSVLYSIVRAKSIMEKVEETSFCDRVNISISNNSERSVLLAILSFEEVLERAWSKKMPSDLCDYVFDLSRLFNSFYKDSKILSEKDIELKASRLEILKKAKSVMEKTMECLGVDVPERMLRFDRVSKDDESSEDDIELLSMGNRH